MCWTCQSNSWPRTECWRSRLFRFSSWKCFCKGWHVFRQWKSSELRDFNSWLQTVHKCMRHLWESSQQFSTTNRTFYPFVEETGAGKCQWQRLVFCWWYLHCKNFSFRWLRMREQNTMKVVPLDVVPERRTEQCSPRFRPGDRFWSQVTDTCRQAGRERNVGPQTIQDRSLSSTQLDT